MHRFIFPLMLLAATAATPAVAQFGFIFGDPPPRPPQEVPGSRRQQPPQQRQEAPPPHLLPPGPPPSQRNIQSQPLPPPPGGRAAPQAPAQAPSGTFQPAQRQPQRGQQPQPQQPVEAAAPPPSDETIVEPPGHKVPNPSSIFAGLDKITGRITSFDATLGETVQFGALQVTPRACYTRPPTETPHTTAFIEVDEVTLQGEIRRIYTGWMFAASPGLHAVEHPIYDIWLTDCKGGQVAAEVQPEPEPEPARARPATRQQQQQRPQQQQPRRQQPLQQRDF